MTPEDASDDDPALLLAPNGNHSWPRPRSPIPPHRLAKLANALGISAPVPHSQASNDLSPSSPLSKPLTPEPRRSPAPSVASTPQLISHSPVPSLQSRFLLHVIPPLHIPHESDSSETFHLTPPPPTASGYHTQFERGTLVPLLPTLQSQLWAIAKEYALPSTAGMILYLVSSAKTPNPDTSVNVPDEPGPRLSEDIWKHLWTRVTRFETESYPRSPNPTTTTGLGFGYLDHPSPLFPPELPSSPNTLRPLVSSGRITPNSFPPPLTPTGSTASSNPPTRATFSESSQSEVDTPDTSLPSDSRAATLDLPGLTSPSVIPILAKVEFDVDKRKATWYGPWIRSRKLNHQKREQRARTGSDSGTSPITECVSRGDSESDPPKAAPLPLRLVNRQAVPRFLLSAGDEEDDSHETGYLPLSESPPVLEDPDPDSTVNPLTGGDPDPLSDVFGSDDDAWADIHAAKAGQPNRELNPNIVELALDGHALSEPAKTETEDDEARDNDEEEVRALWESRERPKLALDIPSPNVTAEHPPHPAGTATLGTYKKAPPPPLTLTPHSLGLDASGEPSPLPSSGSIGLAYLREGVPTPSDGDKRTGTVFEELNLGLNLEDTEEFDENDPNDRRRSQYVFKAKLDEIEKTLARLSPRGLQHGIKPGERSVKSPPWSSSSSLPVNGTPGSANSFAFPSSAPGRAPPEQGDELSNKSWPAVPYSSVRRQSAKADSSSGPHHLLPPPKLSLNGVPSPMPVSPHKKSFSVPHDTERDESKTRRRDLANHEPMYPEIDPSIRKPSNSPIIPLSPDPFGRFSSLYEPLSVAQASTSLGASPSESKAPPERLSSASLHGRKSSLTSHVDTASRPPSSRFSLDSTDEGKNNRTSASLNPVKSIKSLWKKGRKASISFASGSAPAVQSGSGPTAPHSAPPVPNVSNAPLSRSLTLTATPSSTSRDSATSLVLPSDRHLSRATYYDTPSLSTSQLQQAHSSSSINSMVFNQESPYPVHVLPSHPTARPRTVSQSARITSSASPAELDFAPSPTPSSAIDKEKAIGAPRSILKSRRTDSTANPLPPEPQQVIRRSQSRPEIAARLSTVTGSGGRVTTPPPSALEATRLSRRRSNRAAPPPLPRTPEDDEMFKSKDPVPRIESDQRAR